MASVAFEAVSKVFGDGTKAVDSLDLTIEDGEFMVLVGPSGSGKSTALRMTAGLEEISGGRILLGDERRQRAAPEEPRHTRWSSRSYALYPHLTVCDNIGFAAEDR